MPKRKAVSKTSPPKAKKIKTLAAHYTGAATTGGPSASQQNIKKIFDKYRDDATNDPDKIGLDGTMEYLEAIDVALDDVVFMAVFDLVDAPAMGELSREGFVNGWLGASTPSNPCDTERGQKEYIETLRTKLRNDTSYFRQVYKSAFKYAKPVNQRSIPIDEVFAYWDMFFNSSTSGITWNTAETQWYDLWNEYYKEKNKRPVNKDLWSQVGELVQKTREEGGETLGWWSEDGAWPTAIDEFVAFVKKSREEGSEK